jgi:DNA-binding MarR family transcriptional regulator
VLAYIAIIYIKDSPSFCVRQSVIAERCQVSRQTVNTTLGKAKRLGYMFISRERDRGPGQNRADELTLGLPQRCQESVHHPESDVKQDAERCKAERQSDVKQNAERCKAANAVTRENPDPRGVFRGDSFRGVSPGVSHVIAERDYLGDNEDRIFDDEVDAVVMDDEPRPKRVGDIFDELFGKERRDR